MNIRFEAVNFLDNSSNEYDFDNARYLCTVKHADYTEYTKLLYLMQQHDKSEYGNITLRYDNDDRTVEECYSIVDIILVVPKDEANVESIIVYVIGG